MSETRRPRISLRLTHAEYQTIKHGHQALAPELEFSSWLRGHLLREATVALLPLPAPADIAARLRSIDPADVRVVPYGDQLALLVPLALLPDAEE